MGNGKRKPVWKLQQGEPKGDNGTQQGRRTRRLKTGSVIIYFCPQTVVHHCTLQGSEHLIFHERDDQLNLKYQTNSYFGSIYKVVFFRKRGDSAIEYEIHLIHLIYAQGSEQPALAFRSALPGAGDGLIDFQRSLPA